MNFIDVINNRRSVRVFDRNKKIQDGEKDIIIKSAFASPSAMNEQAWEFIVIDDLNILDDMAEKLPHCKMLSSASFCIVVLANKQKVKSALYHQDLSAATQNILLTSTYLNIGSCWIGVAPKEELMMPIKNYFKLSSDIEPFSIIALGKLLKGDELYFKNRYNETVVHHNRW